MKLVNNFLQLNLVDNHYYVLRKETSNFRIKNVLRTVVFFGENPFLHFLTQLDQPNDPFTT